jgi:excisionase family DNA binding protein
MPRPTLPELLTTEEAAALLRCTARSLFNWRRRGLLAGRRVGGRVLYPADEVARLLGAPFLNEDLSEDDRPDQ